MRNGKIVSEVWLRDDIPPVLRALATPVINAPGIDANYRSGFLDALQAVGVALTDDRFQVSAMAVITPPLLREGER